MANLAKIQSISEGQFFVKDSLGNLVELKVGDTISLNDIVVAANSNTDLSKIELLFDTNELVVLSQGETLLDETLLASTFGNEELAFDKKELDETLSAWNNTDGESPDMETAAGDVTEQATNAGNEEAADGGALRSKFNSRDGSSTNVESDLRDTSFGGGNTEEPQEQIPTELLNPTGTTTTPTTPVDPSIPVDPKVPASTITLTGSEVTEGKKIVITATVDKPVTGSDLVIKLDNGEIITISVGKTTGEVEYESRADDLYVQGTSRETISIKETTGGNYEALDIDSKTTVVVEDDDDTVTVKLTATETTTEGGKITYTVTLVDKDGNPVNTKTGVTVELSNGQTIIIDANSSSNSKEINAEKDDVYVDAKDVSVSIKEVTETNKGAENSFENLVADKTPVETKVTDTTDAVKVNVTAEAGNNGKEIKLTLSLTNKDGMVTNVTDKLLTVVVADSLGNKYPIEIPIGSNLSKTITVPNPIPGGGNVTYTVDKESITGGNYEALEGSNTSITTKDIVPPKIISMEGSTVTEAETGTVTGGKVVGQVTITLNKAQDTDLTITLSNGQEVVIEAGETKITVPVETSRVDDAYKQGDTTETITIESTSNSEIDVTNKTATITIKDDVDPTTVKITGTDTTEGGKATFTIELSNKPQTGVPLETVIADFTGRNHKQNELINDGWKIEGDGSMAVGNHSGKTGLSERLLIRDQNDGNDNPTTVTSPTFKIVEGDSGKVSFNFYGSNYNSKDNSFTWKVEKLDTKTGKWEVVQEETISKSISSDGEQLVTTNSLGGGEYRVVYEVKTGEDNKHNKGTENEKPANYGVYIDNVKVTTEKTTGKVQVGDKTYDVVFDEDGKATLKVPVKGNDHYIGEPTLTAKVTEVNGGNFEKVSLEGAEKTINVKDTTDPTIVTITAEKVTDKVITKDNFENNAGFKVYAKNADGSEGVVAKNGNPSGFGVANKDGSGQNANISGAPSEIGMTKDGRSESIEVVFKNPVQELDVAFAWRATQESAKVDFYDENGKKVGHATIFGGNGSEGSTTIQYYNEKGESVGEPQKVQGGSDNVDKVYTFKPAGDVTFTKAVFSAIDNGKDFGQQSDYLINSISYKEVIDEGSTTIVGRDEVAFKISTSKKPDPSKYDFIKTFPKADVKIVDNNGKEVFKGTVDLDKDGKAIVTVITDGTVDLKAEVSNVQGNFEAVDYKNATTEVEGSIKATASGDSFTTREDTPYTLTKDDFGNIGNTTNTQNVAKIKFDTVPANGTIYVLKTEYIGSVNEKADYSESTKQFFDEIKAGDIVDISQINKGNVIFVPNNNSDTDGAFKFKVSSGGISDSSFKGDYTTTIDVKAVADAPTVSIDVTKIEIQNTGNSQISTIRTPDNFKQVLNGSDNSGKPNAGHKVEIFSNKTTNSVSISVEIGNPKQLSGVVRFFDSNGNHLKGQDVLINESTVHPKSGNKTYEGTFSPVGGGSFSSFVVANIDKGSAFHLVGYKYDISGDIADSNKYSFYKVDISSHLTDTDGSEKLSVVIKNVPEGAKLYDSKGTEILSTNGEYKVKVPEDAKDISDSLTMKVPQSYEGVDLQIEATSTEKNDNKDSSTTTGTKDSISFGGGGDIDLSNLKNIVNLKEINLDNGKENKLSLTLDDVLKLSGDDNTIKISGDMFDSVALKNEDGKAWQQKTSITENNKTFDVYSGSIGDKTVEVKVEQQISDGITS